MKIGIINNPRYDLVEEIKWAGRKGFDFIDLSIEPLKAYNIDTKKVKSLLKHYNLSAIGHTNPFLPMIFPIDSIRKVCLKEFRKYAAIFKKLEIKLMNIHPSYLAPFFSDDDKIRANIEFIKEVNKICKDEGITLMIENFLKPFDNPDIFTKILNEVPDVRVHLDVGHCNINQSVNQTEAFFRRFGDKIVHLHFSDNKGSQDDHLPLGCGNIQWEKIINIIKKSGYDKTITLEVFSPDRDYVLLSRDKLKNWWNNQRI